MCDKIVVLLLKNLFLSVFFISSILTKKNLLSSFAIVGKKESRCLRPTIFENVLWFHEPVQEPKKKYIYIEFDV